MANQYVTAYHRFVLDMYIFFVADNTKPTNQTIVTSVKPRLLLCGPKMSLANDTNSSSPHPTTVIVQAPPSGFGSSPNVLTVVSAASENNFSSAATFIAPQPLAEKRTEESEVGNEAKRPKVESAAL